MWRWEGDRVFELALTSGDLVRVAGVSARWCVVYFQSVVILYWNRLSFVEVDVFKLRVFKLCGVRGYIRSALLVLSTVRLERKTFCLFVCSGALW